MVNFALACRISIGATQHDRSPIRQEEQIALLDGLAGFAMLSVGDAVVKSMAMQFTGAVIAAPILIAVTTLGAWSGFRPFALPWSALSVVAKCAFIACSATTAHTLVYLATTRAGAAMVAPKTYAQLLVATAIGWGVLREPPDVITLAGGCSDRGFRDLLVAQQPGAHRAGRCRTGKYAGLISPR